MHLYSAVSSVVVLCTIDTSVHVRTVLSALFFFAVGLSRSPSMRPVLKGLATSRSGKSDSNCKSETDTHKTSDIVNVNSIVQSTSCVTCCTLTQSWCLIDCSVSQLPHAVVYIKFMKPSVAVVVRVVLNYLKFCILSLSINTFFLHEHVINRAVDFFEQSPVEQARLRQLWQVRPSAIDAITCTVVSSIVHIQGTDA
jgi:hypothetical protein